MEIVDGSKYRYALSSWSLVEDLVVVYARKGALCGRLDLVHDLLKIDGYNRSRYVIIFLFFFHPTCLPVFGMFVDSANCAMMRS